MSDEHVLDEVLVEVVAEAVAEGEPQVADFNTAQRAIRALYSYEEQLASGDVSLYRTRMAAAL